MERLVYLDHAATTPMRPDAVAAMLPYLSTDFANPSGSHRFAGRARQAVDEAREAVADAVGCAPGEVVFTSGGTESDNAAITGALDGRGGRAVCPATEHHGVLHVVEHHGGTVVGVDHMARVDIDELSAVAAGGDVSVVSVMTVNNEVGTINDLAATAAVVRARAPDAVVHTDAVQAPCWVDLRTVWPHVDVLSLSGHKFGGPKGVGVMVVRAGVALAPLIRGGGQERDRRSGTHNVAGIVATAVALRATDVERPAEVDRLETLRDMLVDSVVGGTGDCVETVPRAHKVAGSAHLMFDGVENELLLFLLDEHGVCASAASACASGAMEPSHVLAAMGVDRSMAAGALRLSLGSSTTHDDIERGAEIIVDSVRTLRARRARRARTDGALAR